MGTDADYQESLFRVIDAAAELTRELGHPPLLGELPLAVLEPLLPPIRRRDRLTGAETPPELESILQIISFGKGGPNPVSLDHDVTDPAARAVIADLLFRPMQARAEVANDGRWVLDDDGGADEIDVDLARYFVRLREYLADLPLDGVSSPSLLIWELQAAGMSFDKERLCRACSLLVARYPSRENRKLAARAIFLSVTECLTVTSSEAWVPWADTDLTDIFNMNIRTSAAGGVSSELDAVLSRRLGRPNLSVDASTLEALLFLGSCLENLEVTGGLDNEENLIAAWCSYFLAVGTGESPRFLSSAERFGDCLNRNSEDLSINLVAAAAATGYIRANRADLAEPLLRKIHKDKSSVKGLRRIAMCCYIQGKEAETLEAFTRFAEAQDESSSEAFTTSLVLKFGFLARERDQKISGALATAAMATSVRPFGEALASWMDPVFRRLGDKARVRWWAGLWLASAQESVAAIGEAAWYQASASFAEALNLELKQRVIEPFLAANPLLAATDKERDLRAVLERRGTLGQHLMFLRAPDNELVSRQVRAWLKNERKRVAEFVEQNSGRIENLRRLRGAAAHETVTREETRRVYDTARDFLEILHR